ncbi:acetyl-CoA carboxylase biotin carboxylase subunit [Dactylosporangium vinaceum]|uniref:biotin carboxylase n=1 Tax=Dactylosporangium vinaceum TaxID=53362 RepID=A0ABV5M375_9ACTN|nr:acetyl-CoA carboxylase biotin carboxylase subunit [Dactylosporangium vinaceum]UAB99756.1 acetyl-CoA carboxylase biotin carboxylase subunit [Dactylosporangium vinaceum]
MFDKVMVANRGEIALRVVRTCREMKVRSVVCYSEADQDSAAVRAADEAVRIGPARAKRSYLNAAAVLQAALQSGAKAIHPGYGFLSEDADFAEACEDTGIVLIGPPAHVMARLGDKSSARRIMASAGLPVLPGGTDLRSPDAAAELAAEIGYPVIIKAAAGGGGRGMTVVRDPADFVAAYRTTQATAHMLFQDRRVYVERYLTRARHVEVQVLCDSHGNAIHLGERDCSVQRRQQKLIEETPAARLSSGLAERICAAAVQGALAAQYVGAGTFEFLVGPDDDFYFMEVNCRIQVEHPVTEMVTGVDLVREQLHVAAGRSLLLRQEDIQRRGTSIECRINAEDPDRGFAPTPGRLTDFQPPGGPFVRVDTHASTGYTVPPDYDSLLAKVVVWGPDRDQAVERMLRALAELRADGPGMATTAAFVAAVLDDPTFRAAEHGTRFVDELLTARGGLR